MPAISPRALIGDTSFWIAAFEPRDDEHKRAAKLLGDIRNHAVLLPWPITYEVLRTRTVRDARKVATFDRALRELKVIFVDDTPYRKVCLDLTLNQSSVGTRGISLVDMVIREILSTRRYRITRLLTFNAADFSDVCRREGIAIWPQT